MNTENNPAPAERQGLLSRYLDPSESMGEILFGLIMALSFTIGAGLIIKESAEATRELLQAILGCNIAWGIIDAAMLLMNRIYDHSRKSRLLEAIRLAGSDEASLGMIRKELDPRLAPLAPEAPRLGLYQAILNTLRSSPVERTHVERADFVASFFSFWLVFLTALPAVIPFLLIQDRFTALRVSNGLMLVMLFMVGFRWARHTHINPWLFGLVLLFSGMGLVSIAIALGG